MAGYRSGYDQVQPAGGGIPLFAVGLYMLPWGLRNLPDCLRFMDALQHNYGIILATDNRTSWLEHRGDRDYEQSHTFSNVISIRYPWLNLVTLNFGYHNAHHTKPTVPWHELPKLHRNLFGGKPGFVIPFKKQLLSFHKGRVARVFGDSAETEGDRFAQNLHSGRAVGVSGVSFLTPL